MGLFERKRRTSSGSAEGVVSNDMPQMSAVSSTVATTTASTRPTSMRKPPIRPQPTFERIAPPPVQTNELAVLREQVGDLERAFHDKELFDFLLADIDRNRLTQIVTIFADSGRYAEMQSSMELAEKLDDLIRRRLDETHELQRRAITASQPLAEADINQIIGEAETIDLSHLSLLSLQNHLSYFEFHFYRFQDCEFSLLLRLSELIESFRRAIREIEGRVSLETSTPEDTSQHVIQDIASDPVQRSVAINPETHGDSAQEDNEPWETFTPVLDQAQPPQLNDSSSIYGPLTVTDQTTNEHQPRTQLTSEDANVPEVTDSWELFHAEPILDTKAPENENLSSVEVYRISSTIEHLNILAVTIENKADESSDTESAPVYVCKKRTVARVFGAWRRQFERLDNERTVTQNFESRRLQTFFRLWMLCISKRVRLLGSQSGLDKFDKVVSLIRIKNLRSSFKTWGRYTQDSRAKEVDVRKRSSQTLVQKFFLEWSHQFRHNEQLVVSHRRIRMAALKRIALTIWRSHTEERLAQIVTLKSRSVLRSWLALLHKNESNRIKVHTWKAAMQKSRTAIVLRVWLESHRNRSQSVKRIANVCLSSIKEDFVSLKERRKPPNHTMSVSSAEKVGHSVSAALLRQKRMAFDIMLDSNTVQTPKAVLSPAIPKSPIVQYYSISDPEEAPQETPPLAGPIEDLRESTRDIIVKTQIFLSQRRIHSSTPALSIESPNSNHDHSQRVTEWLENHKRLSDNYFTDFEKRWALEEQKWHL